MCRRTDDKGGPAAERKVRKGGKERQEDRNEGRLRDRRDAGNDGCGGGSYVRCHVRVPVQIPACCLLESRPSHR